MTTVYRVSNADGVFYVPTKAEALRLARDDLAAGDEYVHAERLKVTPILGKRELYCALLNGERWAVPGSMTEVPL
jgi:hypothetical protein